MLLQQGEEDDRDCDNANVWHLQNVEVLNAFSNSYHDIDRNISVYRNWSLTFRNAFPVDESSDKSDDNITVYFR